MKNTKKSRGRPMLAEGKRTRKIDARFTEEEYQTIIEMEREFGISRADIIRSHVLSGAQQRVINGKELISQLDLIGGELGRAGNNINQLARYANILKKQNILSPGLIEQFNLLLEKYHGNQVVLEVTLRKVIRLMTQS
ncbi:plasmid mobilization relaxosome protein MobC [Mucilaginibacter sp. PAMB04274]|uniref:plasmid mobilization protein n=1 Tax=Mucilaginibacter sp. PAMB04274 TaxID=3138568 RepID=UPI0031F64B66